LVPAVTIVAWSLLAMFISGFTASVLVLLLAGAVAVFLVLRGRKPARRKLRITIHRKERVVLVAAAKRKNCPACWSELEEGGARARCELNASHEIHEDCRQLVKGKCPMCNGKLN
jgi:hypothetical protein